MPAVLILWHGLNRLGKERLADISLIGASLVFYGLFSVSFAWILICSSVLTYYFGVLIKKAESSFKKGLTISGVVLNLLPLGYYKYMDFFLENIKGLTGREFSGLNLALPIGISFYTFSQIAYLVDTYREFGFSERKIKENEALGQVTFLEFFMYVTYFPKIVQGPIALPYEIIRKIRDREIRKLRPEKFRKGMQLFVIGLSKKVLLGDNLAKIADYGFKYTYYMDTITGILVILSYALQLYFDFSGYCDMAEGVSLMLGIELPANFNSPYKALSVRNLWQRWHITLSRFFTRYIYIPLGGSREGKLRTAFNVLFIFLLSGLWHGAGWTFIIWGLFMGALVVWDDLGIVATKGDEKKHYLLFEKPLIVIPRLCGQIFTFIAFSLSLIFFRSQDMTYAVQMLKQLLIPTWPGFMYKTGQMLDISENYLILQAANLYAKNYTNIIYVICWFILLAISLFVITRKNSREIVEDENQSEGFRIMLAFLFVWSFISLSQVSTFIYFQF